MPKYTVIIGGKERTIDKDKFDGNIEAISSKYPDAKIKAINGSTEGMLPVSNYSKAIQQGYRMVEMNDVEPVAAPVVDSSLVQQRDSVQDYRPVVAGDANKSFDIVKEMNEPTDTQKREVERKRLEEQTRQAKKIADEKNLNAKGDKIQADYDAVMNNPFSLISDPLMGVTSRTPNQVETEKKVDLTRTASERVGGAFDVIEEAKKKGNTTFVSGFGRGFWEKASKASTWDFGARDLQSNLAVIASAKKYSGGLPLSEEEEVLLDAVALEAAALGEFSGDLGRGYKAGGTTAESIPFMAEFMINPATGTGSAVGKAAAKKLITNFGKEAAKSTIGKIARGAARVAGDVAGAGIMAGTSGVMRTSADAVDRMTGEVKPTVDADGYYRFGGTEEGESGMKAFAKSYGASTIENFSEMFGNYLAPIGAAVGGVTGRALNKVGLGKVNDVIGRVKSSDIAKIVDDFQGRTQWNGTIGEYLEEQAGMAMNALTVGDNSLSDLVDVNTQIDTFLGVSAFGGFFSGIKTAGYARQKYAENKQLNEMERKASSVFGEDWKPLKEQIDNADDTELVSILSNTMLDSYISDWNKQLVLLYAGRLKAYHGASLADLKRKTEGETPDEVVQSQFNFDAGYKLAEADKAEKRKAARELRDVESKLDDDFLSADENSRYDMLRQRKDIGEDVSNELAYINAQSKFNGMIQGVRDVIEEKIAQSNQYITSAAHQDGNIYDVTLTSDEKKHVYPISGSIVIGENGIVDRKQSDSRFITRDENGKIEMRSVEDLYKVESTENAEVMKEATAQSIREQESARYAEEIDTPSEEEKAEEVGALQPGNEVSLNMGDVQCTAVVQSVYSDGGIELRFEDKITGHDGKEKNVDVFTADEVTALLIPRETLTNEDGNVKNETEKESEVRENTGEIQSGAEESNTIPVAVEVEAEALPEAELLPDAGVESIETGNSVPVDKKGNLLYHRAPVDATLENVRSYGLDEAETDEFVSAQKVDASKRLEKLQKGKPKVGTNLAKYQSDKKAWEDNLVDVQTQVDYWNEIETQMQATRVQPGDMTAEAITSMGDPMNGEEFAAMMLGTGKLPLLFDDYKRETGFGNQDAKGMFGLFSAKGNGGMSIEQAGERLMEMDAANGTNFFDQSDANAGRNAVIDVLSSSRTRGDLFGYIKGNRERMAEQERQVEYSAYEQWVNDSKHMSVDEYEIDVETIGSRAKEYFDSYNFDEIAGDIADDLTIEENDRRTEEPGIESTPGGSTEGVQGEFDQSAESWGTEQPEGAGLIGEIQTGREGGTKESVLSGTDVVGTQQFGERIGESLFDYAQHIDDSRKIAQAERIVDTEPSEAQKEAGNYKMGHVKIGGHDVTIENPKGSVRRGVGADGKAWETPMNNTYGYFRGTKGKDGDHIDTFLGDNLEPENVYVVDQMNEDGSFDEHKVMYGFDSVEDARESYLSNYEEGWQGLGGITGVSRESFDEWLGSGTKKQKPFAEYKAVREEILADKGIRFRKDGESDSVESHYQAMKEVVDKMDDASGRQTTLAGDASELLSILESEDVEEWIVRDIRETFEQAKMKAVNFPGFFDSETGKVYLCADQIKDEDDCMRRYFHEWNHAVTSKNVTEQQLEDLYDSIGEDEVRNVVPSYYFEEWISKVRVADEYLSHLLETLLRDSGFRNSVLKGDIDGEIDDWEMSDSVSDILKRNLKSILYEERRDGDVGNSTKRDSGGVYDTSKKNSTHDEGNVGSGERTVQADRGVQEVSGVVDDKNGTDQSIESVHRHDSRNEREIGKQEVDSNFIRSEVLGLVEKLHTPIRVVSELNEIVDGNSKLQQRKRDSKGWFDSATGEVVLVLPNAVSVEDAQATILHEVVAHKGLRDMFGKEFDSFLDKVYRDVDEPIRAKITVLSRKYGFDTRVATEEYLAGLAERGFEDVEEKSVWDKVKDFFMDMLSKAGIKMLAPLSDADLRYILWRSYENQINGSDIISKAEDAVRDRDIRGGLIEKPISDKETEVRFREDAEDEDAEDVAKREYEDSLDRAKNKMYRWQEAYQDSMLGLKKMQEAIEKESGEKLQYFENAYMAENQMSSKSGFETDVYKDKFFIPMMDAVRALVKNGAKQKDVSRYVMAKHGLERNVVFAKRDAERAVEDEFRDELTELNKLWDKGEIELELFDERIEELNAREIAFYEEVYQKNRKRDYSGLKQLTDEEENFEEAAMDLVDAFEDAHSSLCDTLWEKVNAATKQTLKKSYESGLMTKSTYDKVRGMFEYYVPLRGWDDKVASDVYEYVLSERSVFQAPVKTAFGRESLADDPFANIGNMAESGILQGNRNLMKQKFLNMVLNHPTSLATVKTMWYENVGSSEKPVWEQSFPDIKPDATADEIAQSIDDHEARMAELGKSGMSKKSTKGVNLDYRASTREINEHIVVVKSGGREYVIFVNGNPRAAQAINGLTNPDATDHKFMQTVGKINRQLAANFTTRNPAFVLSNMSRDVIFSTSAIWVKEDWMYAKRFDKNIAKNIGGIVGLMARYKSGKLDMRNQRDRFFLEFLENGGETGYTALHNVEEYKKMMNRHVRKSNGPLGSLNSGAHAIIDAVSFMNRCAENVSRFTTYQTSREVGRGIAESVRDAKEVTVNFNKKGAGGLGAGTFKSLFLFFNAAVQSLSNFKGLHDKSKGKFYTTLGGFAAAGILLPMLNNFIIESLVGDGDDDMTDEEREQWKRKIDSYDNLPEWVRKNNFCLWTGGEHFITIPLPIELRAFYGLGEMWYQMGRGNMNGVDGKLDAKKVSLGMVNQLTELLPINPLGGNGDAISVLVPDAGKPFYQVMRNRDFFGKPIYKKNDYNELMPAWTKAFSGTAKWMVNSADFVNEASGGDKYMQGSVDLNPATIEHVFEGYFGGVGKTANQLYKTLSMIWDEDERMWRNVPVANRFFTGSDNKISFRKVNDAYYQYLDEYKETEQRLRGYENEAEMDIEKYAEKYDFLNGSKQHERYLLMKEYKSEIDAMRDAIKESDPEEKKEIEMEMNLLKMEMIEELGLIE